MKTYEFLMTINGNYICQRFFNVKNEKDDIRNNFDSLFSCINEISDIILDDIKEQTTDFLWNNYNPYLESYTIEGSVETSKFDDVNISIKQYNKNMISKSLKINQLPGRLDIRENIPIIINKIRNVISNN
jgi:xylose isomerase